jgi:hypothetical protein
MSSQPAYSFVASVVAKEPLAHAAKAAGFDMILIEKAAYDVGELRAVMDSIDSEMESPDCKLFDDDRRSLFGLLQGHLSTNALALRAFSGNIRRLHARDNKMTRAVATTQKIDSQLKRPGTKVALLRSYEKARTDSVPSPGV